MKTTQEERDYLRKACELIAVIGISEIIVERGELE